MAIPVFFNDKLFAFRVLLIRPNQISIFFNFYNYICLPVTLVMNTKGESDLFFASYVFGNNLMKIYNFEGMHLGFIIVFVIRWQCFRKLDM